MKKEEARKKEADFNKIAAEFREFKRNHCHKQLGSGHTIDLATNGVLVAGRNLTEPQTHALAKALNEWGFNKPFKEAEK